MRYLSKINYLEKFSRDVRGSTALIFGISLVAVVGLVGAAVDYSRTLSVRSALQYAADAAALAGAALTVDPDEDELGKRSEEARNVFYGSFSRRQSENLQHVDMSVELRDDGTFVVNANAKVPTYLLGVIGRESLDPAVVSVVTVNTAPNAEIVMVLDVSSSMNENGSPKFDELKAAAKDFVNQITDDRQVTGVKFALVPFAGFVYGSLPPQMALDPSRFAQGPSCFSSPKYPNNVALVTPVASDDDTKFGIRADQVRDQEDGDVPYEDCPEYASQNLQIVPLTDDYDTIENSINAWQNTLGGTNLSLGMLVGWHVMSPEEPFTGGSPIGGGAKQIIVFMTDGTPSVPDYDSSGDADEDNQGPNLATLCDGIKASGIEIYTIFFDNNDGEVEDILESCASDESKFFPTSAGELGSAFEAIAENLGKDLRLTQ